MSASDILYQKMQTVMVTYNHRSQPAMPGRCDLLPHSRGWLTTTTSANNNRMLKQIFVDFENQNLADVMTDLVLKEN